MTGRTLRRYAVLTFILVFVAYFGIWQLYVVMAPALGRGWAVAMAVFEGLGLVVIAWVGHTMIRTMAVMDREGVPRPDPTDPPNQA